LKPDTIGGALIYRFDDFELDTGLYELRRAGKRLPLEPQAFDLLEYLIDHRDRLVPKEELIGHIWPERFISEAALTTRIREIRKALGDSGREQRYVQTAHGRGYRFLGKVRAGAAPDAINEPALGTTSDAPVVVSEQEIRFCTTGDGVRIAYATVGQGAPLVKTANWLSHLEFDWRSPIWRHWLRDLSRERTLVRYDERGCGLSDPEPGNFSFDGWLRDLEAVVDTRKLERFALLGISQGGPVAISYAAAHPERVSHLVLYGTYARGRNHRMTEAQREERQALITLTEHGWGRDDPTYRQLFTSGFIPDAGPEQQRWFNDLQRESASGANAARFMRVFDSIDVREELPKLDLPVLVLHARDDKRVPFEEGRWLAASIKSAQFVPLDGRNHILLEDEPAWPAFVSEVNRFLSDT
jgi:pimeloyl-ACP methyl ester carboxylesterase/DNA-binding winged helix-turn-helix (wHTH) protein